MLMPFHTAIETFNQPKARYKHKISTQNINAMIPYTNQTSRLKILSIKNNIVETINTPIAT